MGWVSESMSQKETFLAVGILVCVVLNGEFAVKNYRVIRFTHLSTRFSPVNYYFILFRTFIIVISLTGTFQRSVRLRGKISFILSYLEYTHTYSDDKDTFMGIEIGKREKEERALIFGSK